MEEESGETDIGSILQNYSAEREFRDFKALPATISSTKQLYMPETGDAVEDIYLCQQCGLRSTWSKVMFRDATRTLGTESP